MSTISLNLVHVADFARMQGADAGCIALLARLIPA